MERIVGDPNASIERKVEAFRDLASLIYLKTKRPRDPEL
jgi:hypothetical protein